MKELELYKELGILTKDRDRWEKSIPSASSLLAHDSVKIQAKALWLLGEMGLEFPVSIQNIVPEIFRVLGKRRPRFVRPYLEQLQQLSENDDNRIVRIHCLGAVKATVAE